MLKDVDPKSAEAIQMCIRDRLNSYHKEVYNKISPYLEKEEKEWLKEATRAI